MRDKLGRFSKTPKRTLESDTADIYWMLQELKRDLKGMRGEVGERLRVIESDIEAMQKVIGVLGKNKSPAAKPFCTCDPSEAPYPCQHRYAWTDCMAAAKHARECGEDVFLPPSNAGAIF